jgi:enoyl-CoA hydratase/carnithine racemase
MSPEVDSALQVAVVAEPEGAIGRITLRRPDAMNAITVALADDLAAAVRRLGDTCDVVVIRGAGGNFCVGGDFHELERLRAEGSGAMATLFEAFGRACEAIAEAPVPVVAAVQGYAMAGGFELLQACDLAVVQSDAVLADNHARFGMVPGGGGSQRLPRLVGRHRAAALILTGDRISGAEAFAWGLAYRAPEPADFDAVLEELVASLASRQRAAQQRTKRLIRSGLDLPLADGLALERDVVVEYLSGEAAGASIATFTENRG